MRPVRRAPAPEETGPASIVPGMSPSSEPDEAVAAKRRSPAGWRSPISAALAEAWALARKHPLEAVAVVLLGLGGLILPFPFWLIGGHRCAAVAALGRPRQVDRPGRAAAGHVRGPGDPCGDIPG